MFEATKVDGWWRCLGLNFILHVSSGLSSLSFLKVNNLSSRMGGILVGWGSLATATTKDCSPSRCLVLWAPFFFLLVGARLSWRRRSLWLFHPLHLRRRGLIRRGCNFLFLSTKPSSLSSVSLSALKHSTVDKICCFLGASCLDPNKIRVW